MPTSKYRLTTSRVEAALERMGYRRLHSDKTRTAYSDGHDHIFITWLSPDDNPGEIAEEQLIEQLASQGINVDALYVHLESL